MINRLFGVRRRTADPHLKHVLREWRGMNVASRRSRRSHMLLPASGSTQMGLGR